VDTAGKNTAEKIKILRKLREARYEQLKNAVYERRGWTQDGIPTLDTVKRLGIDFPEVLEVLKNHGVA
jgi:aldehyde:ferredoxin oxidoreductase